MFLRSQSEQVKAVTGKNFHRERSLKECIVIIVLDKQENSDVDKRRVAKYKRGRTKESETKQLSRLEGKSWIQRP